MEQQVLTYPLSKGLYKKKIQSTGRPGVDNLYNIFYHSKRAVTRPTSAHTEWT